MGHHGAFLLSASGVRLSNRSAEPDPQRAPELMMAPMFAQLIGSWA